MQDQKDGDSDKKDGLVLNPKYELVLGIDPGFTGALALLDPQIKRVVDVYDMPLKAQGGILGSPKASERREIDPGALNRIIQPLASRLALAIVERVNASPGAGVTSMFRFGEGYGLILGILVANGVKTLTPAPSVWKCAMGLTHNKSDSFAAIEQIFGSLTRKEHCARAKDHGRAEAILLALYGSKKYLTAPPSLV